MPTQESLSPNPYDLAETKHWLAHIKSDFWWQHQMPISGYALSFACGYSSDMLSPRTKRFSQKSLERVSRLIDDIKTRRICFLSSTGKPKEGETRNFIWVEPRPKIIARLVQERFWDIWATCAACGQNQFLPIRISGDDRPYVACYQCIPPDQYRSIGAILVEKSLIHEALKDCR